MHALIGWCLTIYRPTVNIYLFLIFICKFLVGHHLHKILELWVKLGNSFILFILLFPGLCFLLLGFSNYLINPFLSTLGFVTILGITFRGSSFGKQSTTKMLLLYKLGCWQKGNTDFSCTFLYGTNLLQIISIIIQWLWKLSTIHYHQACYRLHHHCCWLDHWHSCRSVLPHHGSAPHLHSGWREISVEKFPPKISHSDQIRHYCRN